MESVVVPDPRLNATFIDAKIADLTPAPLTLVSVAVRAGNVLQAVVDCSPGTDVVCGGSFLQLIATHIHASKEQHPSHE